MTGFGKVSEREIHRGHVISTAVGTFVAPDGTEFERDLVHHPGAVSVVPLLEGGSVILVRQYRAALDDYLLEIPAGKRDVVGEDPIVDRAARARGGDRHGRPTTSSCSPSSTTRRDSPTSTRTPSSPRGLHETAMQRDGIEEQSMEIEHVPLAVVPSLIHAGEITDAKTIIGLLMARERLARPAVDSRRESDIESTRPSRSRSRSS